MVQPFNSPSSRSVEGPGISRQTTLRAVVGVADKSLRRQIAQVLADKGVQVIAVSTGKTLDAVLEAAPASLLIVDLGLSKGRGFFAGINMLSQNPLARVIGISSRTDANRVAEAFRAGFDDVLVKPVDRLELVARLALAVDGLTAAHPSRKAESESLFNRLDEAALAARQKQGFTTAGIDLYQHGAKVPVNQDHAMSPLARQFASRVGDDLDLESLIRHTLQTVLEITGPTNAAVFLPGSTDEFSLGGYINHDFSRDNGQMVLEHLAQVLGPKVTGQESTRHMTSTSAVEAWAGDDAGYLGDSQVLAMPVRNNAEPLAGLLFFRDIGKGFTDQQTRALEELSGLFGERLARLIRIHHRSLDGQ